MSDSHLDPTPSFADQCDQETVGALERLRYLVRASGRTQRSIEIENGFQRGYLSQVLQGHITLTVRHLLGMLASLEVTASSFFAQLENGESASLTTPTLLEIRERMAQYDAAFEQLVAKGLLETPINADSVAPTDDPKPGTGTDQAKHKDSQ